MDTLGSCDEDALDVTIRAAAKQALHDWGRPLDDLEDLVQDVWVFYLNPRNVSLQNWVSKAETETGRRKVFYRTKREVQPDGGVVWKRQGIISQILSGNQADDNIFSGEEIYSSDAVKDWLAGKSSNKYLGKLITNAMQWLGNYNPGHLAVIQERYEQQLPEYLVPGAAAMKLSRAVKSLTDTVNRAVLEEKHGEKSSTPSRGRGPRRGVGGYSDPTADLALGLIKSGDDPLEIEGGGMTTYRKEFEQADNIFAKKYDQPSPPWVGVDLFEGELNDRTDMYRAQVFPELYPDENPMLVENWPADDREAYCGGQYTPGYRRLTVVR